MPHASEASFTGSVLVTGGRGCVARVLGRGLSELALRMLDAPEVDLREPDALAGRLDGVDRIVHLASPFRLFGTGPAACADARKMLVTVLAAAAGVRRLVLASSVHATDCSAPPAGGLVGIDDPRPPRTPYGAYQREAEAAARAAAANGLDVVCLRLGGVRIPDHPGPEPLAPRLWLAHSDCVSAFRAALCAPPRRSSFVLFHAVSELPDRLHDIANPLGWQPRVSRAGLGLRLQAAAWSLGRGLVAAARARA